MLVVDLQERQAAAIQAMLVLAPPPQRSTSLLSKQQGLPSSSSLASGGAIGSSTSSTGSTSSSSSSKGGATGAAAAAQGLRNSSSSRKQDLCCTTLLPPAAASWKILLFDNRAKDLLAPLLTVGELRQQGVTLHLPLASARSPVVEAPAVFLVSPSEDNVQQLLQEMQRKLYAFYFFNFTQALSDNLVQLLAKGAVETVEAAVDATAGGLFCVFATLGLLPVIKCPAAPSSPARLVAIRLQEKISTLSPERQAQIFPHLAAAATSAAATSAALLHRPLLMLFDRDVDLSVMLRHTWLYRPLIHDLLDFKLNKVLVPVDDSSSTTSGGASDRQLQAVAPPRIKTFHLENKDAFWRDHCDSCFPEAALAVSEALADYNTQLQRITSQQQQQHNGGGSAATITAAGAGAGAAAALDGGTAGAGPGTAGEGAAAAGGMRIIRDPLSTEGSSTQEILQAVSALPVLAEKKRSLDTHTCIATALVAQIRTRGLDTFFEAEQALDTGRDTEAVENVRRLVAKAAPGTALDKLRLLLSLALAKPNLPVQQLQALEQRMRQDLGLSTASLQYLRQLQSFKALQMPGLSSMGGGMNSSAGGIAATGAGEASAVVRGGASAAAQAAATLSNRFLDKGKGLLLQGVRNLLPAKKVLPITQAVETLMNNKEEAEFLCIDPLRDAIGTAQFSQQSMAAPLQRLPFRCGVAFVVGGASFVEAAALREAATRTQRQILYGSTDFPSPCDFVSELTELGMGEAPSGAPSSLQ